MSVMNSSDKIVCNLCGYIQAKIEECNKHDPLPREIIAWKEMDRYLSNLIKISQNQNQ